MGVRRERSIQNTVMVVLTVVCIVNCRRDSELKERLESLERSRAKIKQWKLLQDQFNGYASAKLQAHDIEINHANTHTTTGSRNVATVRDDHHPSHVNPGKSVPMGRK